MSKKVLIIIPAYNEEDTIYRTVTELINNVSYDYIIINDGSTDNTSMILKQNGFNHINLPVNLGIGGAMQTGYKYADKNGYDYSIQLDADGQHNSAEIEMLVNEIISTNYDMVIGSRFVEQTNYKGTTFRRIGIYFFYLLLKTIVKINITDPTSGYRIVNRRVIKMFSKSYPVDYPEVEVLVHLAKAKYKVKEIKVNMSNRQGGKSSITPIKSLYYMTKVTYFSLIRSIF